MYIDKYLSRYLNFNWTYSYSMRDIKGVKT
jgi:hypothetical protein